MILGQENATLGELTLQRISSWIPMSFAEAQGKLVGLGLELIGLVALVGKTVELEVEVIVNGRVLESWWLRYGGPETA